MGFNFEAFRDGKKLAQKETAITTKNILMTENGVKTYRVNSLMSFKNVMWEIGFIMNPKIMARNTETI